MLRPYITARTLSDPLLLAHCRIPFPHLRSFELVRIFMFNNA